MTAPYWQDADGRVQLYLGVADRRIADQGRKDPAAYKRGADLARKALRDALTEGEPS